jgi:hypothetical protein
LSIVFGIHLLRKLYLVSDTRITNERPSGLVEIHDDLIKLFVINKRVAAVAAGRVALATFILQRLKERLGDAGFFSDLERLVDKGIETLIKEYVDATGRTNDQAGFVFAGHNTGGGKVVDASRLGEIMSLPARQRPGQRIEQFIDPAIPGALEKALTGKRSLEKGAPLTVDVPAGGMFSLSVKIQPDGYKVEKQTVRVYDYAIYHSDQTFKTVKVTDESIATLEFRPVGGRPLEDIIFEDSAILITFVWQALDAAQITAAGGHILTALITPEGAIFPAGELGQIQGGQIVKKGGIRANKEGAMVYTLGDDVAHLYRTINQIGAAQFGNAQI